MLFLSCYVRKRCGIDVTMKATMTRQVSRIIAIFLLCRSGLTSLKNTFGSLLRNEFKGSNLFSKCVRVFSPIDFIIFFIPSRWCVLPY